MNKEIFESIYRESQNQEKYEKLSHLFTKWNDLRKHTSDAYNYMHNFYNSDMYMDAEKVHGHQEAANMGKSVKNNYIYLKAERERTREEFEKLLAECPDFNIDDANRLCNIDLVKYLQDLDKKGLRKDTSGLEQDESMPHINQNITVEINSYKLSPIKQFNGKDGAFVNAIGKDGLTYSFWLFRENNSKIFDEERDIESISGTVNKINNFYGKTSIMLKQVKIEFVNINIYDEDEFRKFYDSLNPEPIKVESKEDLPKNAKLYKTCIKEYERGYNFGAIIKKIYKADDLYYFIDDSWWDTMN